MRYQLPQFIEYEPKIFGPFTFRQFVYVGIAGAACFIVYFVAPFYLFILSCIFLGGGALAFAFLKIGGKPLSIVVLNFLKFNISPRLYIWKKREKTQITIFKKEVKKENKRKEEEKEEELPLKIAERSQLKKLQTQIETKTK